jgi:hypothetical protein
MAHTGNSQSPTSAATTSQPHRLAGETAVQPTALAGPHTLVSLVEAVPTATATDQMATPIIAAQPQPEPTAVNTTADTTADTAVDTAAVTPTTAQSPLTKPQAFYGEENIASTHLSVEEVEEMFASQQRPAPTTQRPATPTTRVGGTQVMDDSDMDKLLRSLGDDANIDYFPEWARPTVYKFPARQPAQRYSADDVYLEDEEAVAEDDDALSEVRQTVRDLEVTVATIDDTTVETRGQIRDLAEDVRVGLDAVDEGMGCLRAQNTALTEEVRELRVAVNTMRQHIATLIRLLAGEPVQDSVPITTGQPTRATAQQPKAFASPVKPTVTATVTAVKPTVTAVRATPTVTPTATGTPMPTVATPVKAETTPIPTVATPVKIEPRQTQQTAEWAIQEAESMADAAINLTGGYY